MYALKTRDIENQTDIAVFHVGMSLLQNALRINAQNFKLYAKVKSYLFFSSLT